MVSFLLNYFVFKKLLLKFHKTTWFCESLVCFFKQLYTPSNTKMTSGLHKNRKVSMDRTSSHTIARQNFSRGAITSMLPNFILPGLEVCDCSKIASK